MKQNLLKSLIILLVTIVATPCLAQENSMVTFHYDANGNRITRQIEIGGNRNYESDGNNQTVPSTDTFKTLSVSLYPNPTEGQFSIAINGDNEGQTLHAILTTATGAVLYDKTINSCMEYFDLSQQPAGVYLLRLTAEDESHVWRVIKKQ